MSKECVGCFVYDHYIPKVNHYPESCRGCRRYVTTMVEGQVETRPDLFRIIPVYDVLNDMYNPERNFIEDAIKDPDNGAYNNNCRSCGKIFIGNKRRFVCRKCADRESESWDRIIK